MPLVVTVVRTRDRQHLHPTTCHNKIYLIQLNTRLMTSQLTS